LTVADVSKLTGLAPHTLGGLRTRGHGPPSFIAAAGLRYRRAGVEAWLEGVLRAREKAQARRRTAPEDEDLDDDEDLDGEVRRRWFKVPFEERLQLVRSGLAKLQATIREQCPGPHEYVHHGDGNLPWCRACGYTDVGLHRSETGLGHAWRRSEEG
jgi:hypothetical protein